MWRSSTLELSFVWSSFVRWLIANQNPNNRSTGDRVNTAKMPSYLGLRRWFHNLMTNIVVGCFCLLDQSIPWLMVMAPQG